MRLRAPPDEQIGISGTRRLGRAGFGTVALAEGFDQGAFAARGGGDVRGRPGQIATRIA